jgi:hypothetical protein
MDWMGARGIHEYSLERTLSLPVVMWCSYIIGRQMQEAKRHPDEVFLAPETKKCRRFYVQ